MLWGNRCYLRQPISPVEIKKDIIKLLEEKEAGRHTLPARNRVALTGAPTDLHMPYIFDRNNTTNISEKLQYIWFGTELNLMSRTSWKYCWAIFKCSRDPFSLKMKLFVIKTTISFSKRDIHTRLVVKIDDIYSHWQRGPWTEQLFIIIIISSHLANIWSSSSSSTS